MLDPSSTSIDDRCDLQETCCSCKSTASTPHFRIHKPTDHDYLTTSTLDSRCPKPNRRHVLPQVDRFPRLTMDEFVSLDCLGLKHDFLSSGAVSAARTILCDALHPALTSVDDRRNRSRAHQSLGSKSLARGKVSVFSSIAMLLSTITGHVLSAKKVKLSFYSSRDHH